MAVGADTKLHVYERVGVPEYWIVDGEAERLLRYVIQDTHYRTPQVHPSGFAHALQQFGRVYDRHGNR